MNTEVQILSTLQNSVQMLYTTILYLDPKAIQAVDAVMFLSQ